MCARPAQQPELHRRASRAAQPIQGSPRTRRRGHAAPSAGGGGPALPLFAVAGVGLLEACGEDDAGDGACGVVFHLVDDGGVGVAGES